MVKENSDQGNWTVQEAFGALSSSRGLQELEEILWVIFLDPTWSTQPWEPQHRKELE